MLNESAALLMLKDYKYSIICCEEALLYANDINIKCKAYKRLAIINEKQDNMLGAMQYYSKILQLAPEDDVKTKVRKWIDENKETITDALKNIIENEKWTCIDCKYMNNANDVYCIECGLHASATMKDLVNEKKQNASF